MKTRALVVLGVVAAVALTACGKGSSDSDGSDGGGDVGFSVSKLTDQFMVLMVKELEAQAKEQSVGLLPATNANGDPAKQNEDIAALLSRGVKGLVVAPGDAAAIVPAIEQANAKKVPVVAVNQGAAGGEIYMTVAADNTFMGDASCKALGEILKGKGTVLNLQGDLATEGGRERSDGFTECMAKEFSEIKIVSKPFDWSAEKCSQVAQTVISTQKIDGIYTASEIGCLEAVRGALKSTGKLFPVGDPNHVPFVGIDGSAEAHDAVRDGTMDAVISQPVNDYAKWGIYWIKRALAGEKVSEGATDHDSTVVKIGDSFYDKLQSPTVTKENVDDPSLWGNG